MSDTKTQRRRGLSGKNILLVFSLCALFDFVRTLLAKRSFAEAVISAVLGLFGTAFYLFILWAAKDNDADDLKWPARFVP